MLNYAKVIELMISLHMSSLSFDLNDYFLSVIPEHVFDLAKQRTDTQEAALGAPRSDLQSQIFGLQPI